MEQLFKSLLLHTPFSNIIQQLADASRTHARKPRRTAITYAWPVRSDEQDLQARVLRMSEDLSHAGVPVTLDLTHTVAGTQLATSLVEWVVQSEVVLLVGSVSYAERAKDPATQTHGEAQALSQKKAQSSDSVIPLLMAGEFWNAFPPGYAGTLGASLLDQTQYFQNFPEIAAKCLDIHREADVIALLKDYKRETENILHEKVNVEYKEQLQAQVELQRKFWASRVLVLRSKFTFDQLQLLDGKLALLDKKVDEFCEKEMNSLVENVAEDTSQDSSSFEARLTSFLKGPELVLLLHAPERSGKTHACKFLARKACKELKWVPVIIHLDQLKLVNERCVNLALASRGLDVATIAHAKATRSFLIVIEGFDRCKVTTNLYVRCRFQEQWRGKVVFPVRSAYIANASHSSFYFMPAGPHQRPKPQGLRIIGFKSKYGKPSDDHDSHKMAIQVPEIALQVAKSNDDAQKSKRARDRWHRAVAEVSARRHLKTYVLQYSKDNRKKFNQGYLLLQRDMLRPAFLEFLASLSRFDPSRQRRTDLPAFIPFQQQGSTSPVFQKFFAQSSGSTSKKPRAFISYAWPLAKSDLTYLQGRLLDLVEDMAVAGIEVLLDILRLSVGVDINLFMKEGIETSDSIFWILTPRLKERINFSGNPLNPATIECLHIQDKVKNKPKSLQPLWFVGDNVEDTYPTGGTLSLKNLRDFRDEKEYFRRLPLLAAQVLDIAHFPAFREHYKNFYLQTKTLEDSISPAAVWRRLEAAEDELKQNKTKLKDRLQELTATIPEKYREHLIGAQEVQLKALHALLLRFKDDMMSPTTSHAQALAFYIPLKGGPQIDTPSSLCFDSALRVHSFLQSENRVLLIQGGAGSGKSLFGHYIEQELWSKWNTDADIIPLFVPLSQTSDPYHDVIQTTLRNYQFSDEHITLLKDKRFVFILDGLDELPVDQLPLEGILVSNQILEWPNAKIIFSCRSQYLPTVEKQFGTTYIEYLLQGQSLMEEFYLMPFDDSQVTTYLKQHAATPDAEWPDWTIYQKKINNIHGLKTLATTPFILKLLVSALPRLAIMHANNIRLHPLAVWQHELEIKAVQREDALLKEELSNRPQPTEDEDLQVPEQPYIEAEETDSEDIEEALRDEDDTSQDEEHQQELEEQEAQKALQELQEQQERQEQQEHQEQQDHSNGEGSQDDQSDLDEMDPTERQDVERRRDLLRMSSRDVRIAHETNTDLLRRLLEPPVQKTVLRVDVYEAFVDQWFEQEMWKEMTQHDVPLGEDRKANYRDLSGKLSKALFSNGTTQLPLSQLPANYSPQLIRGMPVQLNGDNISFVHRSLQEYFAACEWIKDMNAGDQEELSRVMSTRLITNEVSFLLFISQLFREVPHKESLLGQVYASRSNPYGSIAAANAITILNTAHCPLSNLDLSQVDIRGANLDHALMDHVNLHEANMTDVCMRQVWLCGADLRGANMTGVQFGQVPWIECGKPVQSMALDREGRLVIGTSGHVEVWDLQCNTRLTEIPIESPLLLTWEGKIISCSKNGVIELRNITTGMLDGPSMIGSSETLVGMALSSRSTLLAASSNGIWEWDLTKRTQIGHSIRSPFGDISALTVYEDRIVVGDGGTIVVWDYTTRTIVGQTHVGHKNAISTIKVHRGKIVSAGFDRTMRIWDLKTLIQVGHTISLKGQTILCVTFVEDKIITGTMMGTIAIWDLSTAHATEEFRAHNDRIVAIKTWKDKIISGSKDGSARMWELSPHQRVRKVQDGHDGEVKQVFIFDGRIVSRGYGGVRVWDLATGQQDALTARNGMLHVSDGRILFASVNFVQAWDITTRREAFLYRAWNSSSVLCMTESNGKLITGDYYGYVVVADLQKGKMMGDFQAHDDMLNAVVVVDGLIVSASDDGAVHVWDLAHGNFVHTLKEGEVYVKCLVPFVDKVIAGSDDGILRMWKAKEGKLIGEMKGHNGSIWCLAVATCVEGAEERGILLSGGMDNSIRLWDLQKCQSLLVVQLDDTVRSLSCQGEDVAVACGDRVQHWKIKAKLATEEGKKEEREEEQKREVEEKREVEVSMYLSSSRPDQWPICMIGSKVDGVIGLSKPQVQLVSQLQASGVPL